MSSQAFLNDVRNDRRDGRRLRRSCLGDQLRIGCHTVVMVDEQNHILPNRNVPQHNRMEEKGKLAVFHHGKVMDFSPSEFPSGSVYIEAIQAHGVELPPDQRDPGYWQACARMALLKQFGLWNDKECMCYSDNGVLILSAEDIHAVNRQWNNAIQQTTHQAAAKDNCSNDLLEFLETGTSNQRTLEFASMRIAPGYELHCHAHPNLELAYCVQGTLHEIRVKDGHEPKHSLTQYEDGTWQGPDMSQLDNRSWTTKSLPAGAWLVNPVGSIHKSFTDFSEGCLLILLFGGSEANVQNEHVHSDELRKAIHLVSKK